MRARQIIAERNRRESLFPGMGEPAWLMLVDLYVNAGRDISVTSACLASFAPVTTALRYVGELEAGGLIERRPDCFDRRRVFLRLTSEGHARLNHFFDIRVGPETPRDDCGEVVEALPSDLPASVDLNSLHDTRGDRAERFCVVGVDNLLHSETTATGAQT